ncbi:MAG TPA: hypothetical protein VKU00_28790 [Chthonomonadaceae bacterium]|nr:hypothetical protein [Chthonomonadaceae bacterium]
MASAPLFRHGEVSWNHPETLPSTEVAANLLWRELLGTPDRS